MASTYENDLRLEEMATGENSGSWGTKTNTNLELIADAFSYGTETIADADTTVTIADGAADAARSLALKINSSVDLTTTRTVTLAPNTTSKVWIIENNTSGGQVLTISAGSGSNVTLPNGVTKIIATDGIGAAANVTELYTNLHNITIDGVLSLADGTNSAPSLTNTGDTNTGLYFPAADEVGITVGGTQVFKADSTGANVTGTLVVESGIGNTALLGVSTDSGTEVLLADQVGGVSFKNVNGDMELRVEGDASTAANTRLALKIDGGTGDITFYDTDGATASFVYDASAGSTFNEQGADRDFRVESDTNTHALFVDANVDRVGVGAAPMTNGSTFQVTSDSTESTNMQLTLRGASDINKQMVMGFDTTANTAHVTTQIAGSAPTPLIFKTGNVVFNEASSDSDFRVESDGNTHMLFVDAGSNTVGIGDGAPTEAGLVVAAIGTDANTSAKLALKSSETSVDTYLRFGRFGTGDDASFTIANNYYRTSSGYVADDTSWGPTSIYFGDGEMSFSTVSGAAAPLQRMFITGSEIVANEQSYNQDFRVESDNGSHMFLVDAGVDKVLVNTNLTSTQDVEPSTPAPMSVKNGLFLFRDLATSGNDRNLFNLDTNGSWGNSGNAGTYTNIRWSNGASNTMGQFGLTYGNATTVTGANSEFAIQGLFHTNYGNSGVVAAFGANQSTKFMGGVTVNENGNNQDFRVESDTNTHALFVDAGNGRIGINQDVPGYTVDVVGGNNSNTNGIAVRPLNESQTMIYSFLGMRNTYYTQFTVDSGNTGGSDYFQFFAGTEDVNGELLFLGDGATTFNEGGHDRDFRVESDSDTHMLFVDTGNNTLSVGTSLAPTSHAVNNPTMNIARAAKIGDFVYGSVENIYNSGSGRVFTVNAGSNGQAAMLQITAANHNGVIEQCFYLRNDAGTWVNIPGPVATSGTPPTITVVSNAGGTATFTVLGVGNNPNYYNQGYLIYKTSNAVTLTT